MLPLLEMELYLQPVDPLNEDSQINTYRQIYILNDSIVHLTFHIIRVANTTTVMNQGHTFTDISTIYRTTVPCTDNKLLISNEIFIPKRKFHNYPIKIQYSAVSSVL